MREVKGGLGLSLQAQSSVLPSPGLCSESGSPVFPPLRGSSFKSGPFPAGLMPTGVPLGNGQPLEVGPAAGVTAPLMKGGQFGALGTGDGPQTPRDLGSSEAAREIEVACRARPEGASSEGGHLVGQHTCPQGCQGRG